MESTTLRFERGSVDVTQLQAAVDVILASLSDGNNVLERITVEEEGSGIDPLTAGFLVGIVGNVASHYLIRAWEEEIWPRLRDRLGDDALGARKDND